MKYFPGVLLLFFWSCSGNHYKAEHSFYYWKTTFPVDSSAQKFISEENINHFFIHYFDVDWDDNRHMPAPLAEIECSAHGLPFVQSRITPVVFITNRCFEKMSPYWCDSLAVKIRNRITYISNKLQRITGRMQNNIEEIQIDCDWTATTRDIYFSFLKSLKALYPGKVISATIRLYPYKYSDQTGVPPVDKGLLMCYNLTDIKNTKTANSILDTKDLRQYLTIKKYPLPLDVALPVFGWYAWFSNEKFKGIIYPNGEDPLTADEKLFKKNGNYFLLTADTLIGHNYLREGDVVRHEYPGTEELKNAATILHKKFPRTARIALFYWDPLLIRKNAQAIHQVYNSF